MSASTTVTIRLPVETKDKLARLAGYTNRKQSYLGAEAIADYVARELAIVEAIEEGRRDIREGRIHSHEEVVAEARAIIEAARSRR